jgi:hypothetical protein
MLPPGSGKWQLIFPYFRASVFENALAYYTCCIVYNIGRRKEKKHIKEYKMQQEAKEKSPKALKDMVSP